MIDTILWDIDGTLLDFSAAEKAALQHCFQLFQLGSCSPAMLQRYSAINKQYWQQLEKGEVTKPEVLTGRFQQFFKKENITCDPKAFNQQYQKQLGEAVFFTEGAKELVASLQGTVRQYAVTNGTRTAQRRKLKKSGLDTLLDGIFISDEIGAEKPDIAFFQHVFNQIAPFHKHQTLIVGDSLSSDMAGGSRAGIICCWYNPKLLPLPLDPVIQYQIQQLSDVKTLL